VALSLQSTLLNPKNPDLEASVFCLFSDFDSAELVAGRVPTSKFRRTVFCHLAFETWNQLFILFLAYFLSISKIRSNSTNQLIN